MYKRVRGGGNGTGGMMSSETTCMESPPITFALTNLDKSCVA